MRGAVMVIGGVDTGKTSFCRALLAAGLAAGRSMAYVDSDVGQSTVGPPACAGMKWVRSQADLDGIERADELRFVGSTSPDGVVLQQVVAAAALVELARASADLVVLDTTGAISGVIGQTLKYHKMELARPEAVVALERGGELEPLIGLLRRFFDARVEVAALDPEVLPVSVDERRARRAKQFAAAFGEPLQRWRVRPTVFAPSLPAGLDLRRLDRMLVGVQDASGRCRGLGALEHSDDTLRVITNAGEDMRGLRLGTMRIDLDTFETERIRLKAIMFGV